MEVVRHTANERLLGVHNDDGPRAIPRRPSNVNTDKEVRHEAQSLDRYRLVRRTVRECRLQRYQNTGRALSRPRAGTDGTQSFPESTAESKPRTSDADATTADSSADAASQQRRRDVVRARHHIAVVTQLLPAASGDGG